jgi:diguanylate cyclase (GGDEF)-like protein/PAS domain S-box-containing protein
MAADTPGAHDEAIRAIFEMCDDVWVAAIGADGHRLPMPESVDYPGQHLLPVPETRATMVDLAVPADWMVVIGVWERALKSGIAFGTIHMLTEPDRRMTITIADTRDTYGVMLGMLSDETGPAATDSTDDRPELMVTALRPRQATLTKSMTAVITTVDPTFTAMLGWEPDDIIGLRSSELLHDDDIERAISNWMELLANLSSQRVRYRHRRKDGSWLWVEVEHICHPGATPEDMVVEARIHDISDEMAAHEAVRYREQLFSRLAESLPTGVMQVLADGSAIFANQRLHHLLGEPTGSPTLDWLLTAVTDEHRGELQDALDRAFAGDDSHLEVEVDRDGERRRGEVAVVAVTNQEGEPTALICVDDITESAQLREDLYRRATFDQLTGCHNRASVIAALDAALAGGPGDDTAVVFIDLDKFKPVNDLLGHAAGDDLLALVAERLRSSSRPSDIVGRLGGDEFLLVCRHLDDPATQVQAIAERITFALSHPVVLAAGPVELSASIGLACSTPGMTSDALVSLADHAMYVAKSTGSGPVLHSA